MYNLILTDSEMAIKDKKALLKALDLIRKEIETDEGQSYLWTWKNKVLDIDLEGDTNYIRFNDYCDNWGDDTELMLFLAPFLKKGYAKFCSEDGDRWGYEFDGEGGLYEIEYVQRRGNKINL